MTMAPFAHLPSPSEYGCRTSPDDHHNQHQHYRKETIHHNTERHCYQSPFLANTGCGYGCGIPMRNHDGSIMLDHKARVVYKSQYLSTNPLKSDCKERVGYGGRKFTYVSGDGVIRTMNSVFGFGGWGSEITMERMVLCEQDKQGRWVIGYLATVRIRLKENNEGGPHNVPLFHEDCGSGEAINANKIHAHEKALKSAVTDAMKRAARHFGERLGNALYIKGNSVRNAPLDNKTALDQLEKSETKMMYGDQIKLREQFEEKHATKIPRNTNNDEQETSNESSSSTSSEKSDRSGDKNENMQDASALTPDASVTTVQQKAAMMASTPISSMRQQPLPRCRPGHNSLAPPRALVTPQQKPYQQHQQWQPQEAWDAGCMGTRAINTPSGSNQAQMPTQGQQQQQQPPKQQQQQQQKHQREDPQQRSRNSHAGRNIFPQERSSSQLQPKQFAGQSGYILPSETATTSTALMSSISPANQHRPDAPRADTMPPPSARNGPDDGGNGCGHRSGGRNVGNNSNALPSSIPSSSGYQQRCPQGQGTWQGQLLRNHHQPTNGNIKQNNQFPQFGPLSFTNAVEDEEEDGEQIQSKVSVDPLSPRGHTPPPNNTTSDSIAASRVLSSSPPPPNPLKRSTLNASPGSKGIGNNTGNKKQALARNPYNRP